MAEYLVIHIPGDVEPIDRGGRFEDPLDKALKKAGKLGRCVGGGTAVETKPEFRVTGCDIEVEVTDLAKALPVIRDALQTAACPSGTTLTHTDTNKVLLRFSKSGVKQFAPSTKVVRKKFEESCPWKVGEVLAYRIARDHFVLFHVLGFGGIGPLFWIPEWCGSQVPDAREICRLVRKNPEFYRLGSVYSPWRARETDRDDRKLIRTGVVVPPPNRGLRGWFPGVVQVRPWKVFERMLKEVFGLVSVSPPLRLNHDLSLKTSVVHLAVWHAAGDVSPEEAKRLFYGRAGRFRRTRRDREKQPTTEELKAFVTDLKAHFESDNVWLGTFSADEGLILLPVKRKRAGIVWPVAARLARRYGLACYDPETQKLVRGKGGTRS